MLRSGVRMQMIDLVVQWLVPGMSMVMATTISSS